MPAARRPLLEGGRTADLPSLFQAETPEAEQTAGCSHLQWLRIIWSEGSGRTIGISKRLTFTGRVYRLFQPRLLSSCFLTSETPASVRDRSVMRNQQLYPVQASRGRTFAPEYGKATARPAVTNGDGIKPSPAQSTASSRSLPSKSFPGLSSICYCSSLLPNKAGMP